MVSKFQKLYLKYSNQRGGESHGARLMLTFNSLFNDNIWNIGSKEYEYENLELFTLTQEYTKFVLTFYKNNKMILKNTKDNTMISGSFVVSYNQETSLNPETIYDNYINRKLKTTDEISMRDLALIPESSVLFFPTFSLKSAYYNIDNNMAVFHCEQSGKNLYIIVDKLTFHLSNL